MSSYQVTVQRGDRFWLVHVPEIDQWTQARHLREVEEMARDLIAIMTGVEPHSFELDIEINMPSGVAEHVQRASELREVARTAQAQAAQELRDAARELRQSGMPLRDVGQMLGVSYQRAHQLVGR